MSLVGHGTNDGDVCSAQTLVHFLGVLVWFLVAVGPRATLGAKDLFQFTDCSSAFWFQGRN